MQGQYVEKDELHELREHGVIKQNGADYGGSWFRKYKTGVDKLADKNDAFKTQQRSGRSLEDFIDEGDESERDEDDIYQHYQEMMSRRGE